MIRVHHRVRAEPRPCADCGSSHLGPACGMTWLERMKGVQVDGRVQASATKRRYFDSAALDRAFGTDRKERYMDMTRGTGAVRRSRDGTFRSEATGERMDPNRLFGRSPVIHERLSKAEV